MMVFWYKSKKLISLQIFSLLVIERLLAIGSFYRNYSYGIIEDLCSITKEMLKAYHSHMRVKPHKTIMFRDGVSEGQFQQVPTLFSSTQNCKFLTFIKKQATQRCVKSVFIRSFVVHVFPHSDRVRTDRVSLRIPSKCAKMGHSVEMLEEVEEIMKVNHTTKGS